MICKNYSTRKRRKNLHKKKCWNLRMKERNANERPTDWKKTNCRKTKFRFCINKNTFHGLVLADESSPQNDS